MADSNYQSIAPSEQVCNLFRKPTKNTNIRRNRNRAFDDDDDQDDGNENLVLHNARKIPKSDNKLYFASAAGHWKSESGKDSMMFEYESSKEIQVQTDSKATAALETETDFSGRDARAIREGGKGKASAFGELYKGLHGYQDYKAGFRREQTNKAGGSHGPLRASTHIRVSARFDYQPDLCKDYKDTGYCGYGDSCKFMHDRSDYKSGWQMDKECDDKDKARKTSLAIDDEDVAATDNEDAIPFACFICRQPFVDPVVTKCNHYFCQHCALKHHSRNKKCFVCNQPTLGIFNTAPRHTRYATP